MEKSPVILVIYMPVIWLQSSRLLTGVALLQEHKMSEAGVMFYTLYISSLLLGLPPPTVVSVCVLGGKKYLNTTSSMRCYLVQGSLAEECSKPSGLEGKDKSNSEFYQYFGLLFLIC